ncbi:MAG: alpha/beta fold hydrolase [Candidatus Cyclobacteriaceae bacterium M3_2C_046]
MELRTSDTQLKKYYGKKDIKMKVKRYTHKNHQIRYAVFNPSDNLPVFFFIHGAPGHLNEFKNYYVHPDLHNQVTIIAPDRPGYGYSNYGQPEVSIIEQAKALLPILEQSEWKDRKVTLIGHSYGGPVAAFLAWLHLEKVNHLVLLAPALDPELEKIFWFSHLGRMDFIRWIMPKSLQVATDEKFSHQDALREITHIWPELKIKTTVFQGDKDWIVPPENLHFIQNQMDELYLSMVILKDESHFIHYHTRPEIVNKLKQILQQ